MKCLPESMVRLLMRLLRLLGAAITVLVLTVASTVYGQGSTGINGGGPNGATGGTPGGSPNQVQANIAGAFGGITNGASGTCLVSNGVSSLASFQSCPGGGGTVTSVGQTVPSWLTVTGSPVTTSGVLVISAATGQPANQVLATPNGSTGAVALRALVGADIPQINLAASGNGGVGGTLPQANILPCAANQIVFDNASAQLTCSSALTWNASLHTLQLGVSGDSQETLQTPNGSSGGGTNLNVTAGNAGGANANGGDEVFTTGQGNGTGRGGNFTEQGGTGSGTGPGGGFTLGGGSGNNGANFGAALALPGGPASGATGSDVVINGTAGADAAHSGNVIIQDFNLDNTLLIDPFGNIICACATGTTATDQFLYIGKSSGVPTGVPAHITGVYANSIPVRFDTTDNRLYSYNSGWQNVADNPTNKVISCTTGSIGGSALLAGQCSAGTASCTGATTSMVAGTSPSSDPDSSLSTGVGIYAFVSGANTVTVRVCAIVAVTPTATTYNVRVQP